MSGEIYNSQKLSLSLSLSEEERYKEEMVSSTSRVLFRLILGLLILLTAFYIGRPLYWKISATIHEIQENRTTIKQGLCLSLSLFLFQFVCSSNFFFYFSEIESNCFYIYFGYFSGISQLVFDAQKSIGWIQDDSIIEFNRGKVGSTTSRRILRFKI